MAADKTLNEPLDATASITKKQQLARLKTVAAQDAKSQSASLQNELPRLALRFAQLGDEDQAWALAGEIADIEQSSGQRTQVPVISATAAALHRKMNQLSPDERYEQLLKWTMPDKSHATVRFLNVLTTDVAPPSEFARALGERPSSRSFALPSIGTVQGVFSTAWILAMAAEETGTLSTLRKTLQDAKTREVAGAEYCLLIANIVDEQNDQAFQNQVQQSLDEFAKRDVKDIGSQTSPLDCYVLGAACLTRTVFRDSGLKSLRTLAEQQKTGGHRMTRMHTNLAILKALGLQTTGNSSLKTPSRNADNSAGDNALAAAAAPKHWIPVSVEDGTRRTAAHIAGPAAPVWLSHEDHLMHVAGRDLDFLCFRYPLTGDFQFSVDGQDGGPGAMGSGLLVGGLAWRVGGYSSGPVFSLSASDKQDLQESPCPFVVYQRAAQFNRLAMTFEEQRTTAFVNGQTMWSETIQGVEHRGNAKIGSSPWVGLRCSCEFTPLFRDLKITGHPQIPREVVLSQPQMRGWIASWFNESRPPVFPELPDKQQGGFFNGLLGGLQQPKLEPDWSIADGVITRKALKPGVGTQGSPSRLYYFRPLQNGESVTYEFHMKDTAHIHPTLGRTAFHLDSDGVRVQWIVDSEAEWTGLTMDDFVVDPLSRRGPTQLPLIKDDWNKVTLAVIDDALTLSLNGTVVLEKKVDSLNSRQFGFLTSTGTGTTEVRNVVLTGDWPEQLSDDMLNNLSAPVRAPSQQESELLTSLLGDHFLAENVASVRQHAKTLPPKERFQFLSDWVLPTESRKTFRLNGHFSPLSPGAPVAEYTVEETQRLEAARKTGEGRVLVGGSLFSAAFDLVDAASETDKLDELRKRVLATKPLTTSNDPFDANHRARLAMLALIEIAAKRTPQATEHLLELGEIAKTHPISNPAERWPELLAFWQGIRNPDTCATVAEPLYQFIFRDLHGGPGTGSDVWDRQLLALMGFKKLIDSGDKNVSDYFRSLPLKQWAPAEFDSALNRGPGMPGSRWIVENHGVSQLSGHENDFLYFQSPLRGNYQIDCLTATFDWRETEMFFAGRWAGPAWGMTHYESGDHRRSYRKPSIGQKMATDVGDWFHVQIQCQNGIGRIMANGRQLYEVKLPPDYDPWIGGRFWHRYHGGIRDIMITGTPEIPESLNLVHDKQMTGWAAYYEQRNFEALESWLVDDDDNLIGERIQNPVDANYERLLRYHRPMLEDGTIEYEFYYRPESQHVHPTLDRLTFLLDPDAIRIHWCTDGAFDRTGLSPLNVTDEPEHQLHTGPLPLKVNDWNRLKLNLTGDIVTLVLNDAPVFRRQLEPSNMRRFGFFHFPGRTGARVRNVVWTGNWPKQLPPLPAQELADLEFITRLDEEAQQMKTIDLDFTVMTELPPGFKVNLSRIGGTVSEVRADADGLHTVQEGKVIDGWTPLGIVAPYTLAGDFDIIAEFDGAEMPVPQHKERFSGVNLSVKLDSPRTEGIWFHARRRSNGEFFLDTMTEHKVDGNSRWDVQAFAEETSAGKLRLSRRGYGLYYLFANGDSDQFRLYRTQPIPDAKSRPSGVELQTLTGSIGQTSATWRRLTIRAAELSSGE